MKNMYPFHLSLGVNDILKTKKFYEETLGCRVGRIGKDNLWFDIDFYGHQVVFHYISDDYTPVDIYNEKLGDGVPAAHFGLCLNP